MEGEAKEVYLLSVTFALVCTESEIEGVPSVYFADDIKEIYDYL